MQFFSNLPKSATVLGKLEHFYIQNVIPLYRGHISEGNKRYPNFIAQFLRLKFNFVSGSLVEHNVKRRKSSGKSAA